MHNKLAVESTMYECVAKEKAVDFHLISTGKQYADIVMKSLGKLYEVALLISGIRSEISGENFGVNHTDYCKETERRQEEK